MSVHIILQRFAAGQAVPFDYATALSFFQSHGEIGRGLADQELCFADAEIASTAILVGDDRRGIECVLVEEAKPGPALQEFLFSALQALGACAYDDELRAIYLHHNTDGEPPTALVDAAISGVHRIVTPEQIWPEPLARPAKSSLRYATFFENPNRQGRPYQIVDSLQDTGRLLRYDFFIHPAACHPAVCRAFRQIWLRIELARRALSEKTPDRPWRVELSFQHNEAFLTIIESPAPAELACSATTVTGPPGTLLSPGRNAFRADLDRVATAEWNSQRCVQQAREEFGITLIGGLDGAVRLDALLQKVHERLGGEYRSDFARELVVRWCWFAGSAFGEIIRHEVGAQWGTLPLGHGLHPALRTHSGRYLFPLLRVLDKLHRGSAVSLAAELEELLGNARSRIYLHNGHDEVAALPSLFDYMIGKQLDREVPFPLYGALAIAELDGSPTSLLALDRWLQQLAPDLKKLPQVQLTRLVRCAGAYLGEVICRSDPAAWLWENHHDYFDGTPGLPEVDYELATTVVLRGHGALLFPYGTVLSRLTGGDPRNLLQWLLEQVPGATEYVESLERASQHGRGPDFFNLFTEESASRFATHIARQHPQLDGEPASIGAVDQLIAALKEQSRDDAQIAEEVGELSCYAGDLAVRHFGASWQTTGRTQLAGRSRSPIVLRTSGGSVVDPFASAFRALRLGEPHCLHDLLAMIRNEAAVRANIPADQRVPPAEAAVKPTATKQSESANPGNGHATATPRGKSPNAVETDAQRRAAEARAEALLEAARRKSAEQRQSAPSSRFSLVLLFFVAPMGGLFASALHSGGAGLLVGSLAAATGLWLRRASR